MRSRSKVKIIEAFFSRIFNRTKQELPNPQPTDHHESNVIRSATPSIVIANESSEVTETNRNTAGIGDARNGATVNYDATIITASDRHSGAPNIVGNDHEAPGVYTNATGGFLRNTHHLILNNPIMVDNSTNIVNQGANEAKGEKVLVSQTNSEPRQPVAKKLLSKHMIPGAAHDSSARDPPPQCHPGTRIKINERIVAWFYNDIKQELILWIHGPAGVGKSAIVQTFAEVLALAECLGASVFFSRPNGRNDSRSVFITIAYQLAVHIEPYCTFVCDLLAFDPEVVNKSMEEQFKAFIVKPFVEKKIGAGGRTWGIVLDGLDELDERDRQQEIICLITTFVHNHPEVPVVWVMSSRPEPHITNTFKQQQLTYNCKEECVPINSPEACQDVERYLRGSFKTIHIRKTDFS